jgi:Sec-independent protein translocase protein TatA
MPTLIPNPLMLADIPSVGELVLIFAVMLFLVGVKKIPGFLKGLGAGLSRFRHALDQEAQSAGESLGGIYGKPAAQALTTDNQSAELYDPEVFHKEGEGRRAARNKPFRKWFIKFVRVLFAVVAKAEHRQFTGRWISARRAR